MRSDFTTEDDSAPDPKLDPLRDGINRLLADIEDAKGVIGGAVEILEYIRYELEALMSDPYQPPDTRR